MTETKKKIIGYRYVYLIEQVEDETGRDIIVTAIHKESRSVSDISDLPDIKQNISSITDAEVFFCHNLRVKALEEELDADRESGYWHENSIERI